MKRQIAQASLLVLALAGASAPVCAQKQAPPEGAAPRAFTLPAHEVYALPNGMKVTLVPYGIIPKVTIGVTVNAGGVDEGSAHRDVANMTASLMKEGTATLTSSQLADEAARMGSSLTLAAGVTQTEADLDVLSEFGPDAVGLIADLLQHPRLPESELARLKNDRLRQIAIGLSRPQTLAEIRFSKILYGDHPYGVVLPTEDDVKKITIDDIRSYVHANFNASRAHIYVAGRFDSAAMKKAIADKFSGWAKEGSPRVAEPPVVEPHHVLEVIDRPDASQSTLLVGLPVPPPASPDNIPIGVMNALLGGSFNSRITANIREQKGYTYSPYSFIQRRYHDAYWAESADVTTKFTGPSLKEIFGEIQRLSSEAPTDKELKGIQSYLSGIFVLQNSSRSALINQLEYVDLQGLGEDYLKNYVSKVNAVTTDDVQKMAAKYIRPDQMTIVVVGDKAKIADQLTPFETTSKAQ